MPSDMVMKLAEQLYQAGFISYPRTETDEFDDGYDLRVAPNTCLLSELVTLLQWNMQIQEVLEIRKKAADLSTSAFCRV